MKTATITCHRPYNYGAVLQTYALQQYINKNGAESEVLDYIPLYLYKDKNKLRNFIKFFLKLPDRIKGQKTFGNFLRKYICLSERSYRTFNELLSIGDCYDLYITGSDQVWNMNMDNGNDDSYFLRFASGSKISYAASIAMDRLTEEQKKRFRDMLMDFNAVSVREGSAVKLLRDCGVECSHVCDPVFLLNTDEWDSLAVCGADEEYILVYAFYGQREVYEYAKKIASEKKCRVYAVGTDFIQYMYGADKYFWCVSPREFIGLIKNAVTVVTNSFHGMAFSLIYNKPFAAFKTLKCGNSRITELFRILNVDCSEMNLLCTVKQDDYKHINKELDKWREHSKNFLRGCGI